MVRDHRHWDGKMTLEFEETMKRLQKDIETLASGNLQEKIHKARATARLEMILNEVNSSPKLPVD